MSNANHLEKAAVMIASAAKGLPEIDVDLLMKRVESGLYPDMTAKERQELIVLEARPLIETDPAYSKFAARLSSANTTKEVARDLTALGKILGGTTDLVSLINEDPHNEYLFKFGVQAGINLDLYNCNPALKFEMAILEEVVQTSREEFDVNEYLGFQTLYDRYFLRYEDYLLEDYYTFYMRVAMGHALREDTFGNEPTPKHARTQAAVAFFYTMMENRYSPSTPSLFNGLLKNSQMSSCYLTTIPDDLKGIYGGITDNAMLSKFAGGLGNDWTPVRSLGARIKGTNGKSQGIIPFLKVANDTAVAVNQGGKRKGATCAFLECWHADVEEFLELRKNTGDDRRRTHDMNTANWIPDLFMERLFQEDSTWTLFSPNDVPELHDLYGQEFKYAYEEYERKALAGKLKNPTKVVKTLDLWRKMLGMVFETGHPWITFKDPCNLRSPQRHTGVVHSSNLCTEITLNTKANEEIAVCNLGSVNVAAHIDNTLPNGIDTVKLRETVRTAIRMLDNVIDANFYPVETARASNMRHRPIGLGIMGLQDALYLLGFPYDSEAAIEFSDIFMEYLSYYAIEASSDLARERTPYQSFEGSLWNQGYVPLDTIQLMKDERSIDCYMDQESHTDLDWDYLRQRVAGGMRNSNVMAIAPTATISNIFGVTQSIEPTYQNLYVKSNLSGEFTVINPYLFRTLKALGLWDQDMVDYLKVNEGSVQAHPKIPDDVKALFRTSFEADPMAAIDAASRRQKWIDQAQSLNLYVKGANGRLLDSIYKRAWVAGLKTTYYLRALAATTTEKSTVNSNTLNKVSSLGSASPQTNLNGLKDTYSRTPTDAAVIKPIDPVIAVSAVSEAHPAQEAVDEMFTKAADVPNACSLDNPDCEACQ